MGHFFTEKAGFESTPALLGNFSAVHGLETFALGVVHSFVPNIGDAWVWSADCLRTYLACLSEGSEDHDKAISVQREYLLWVRRLGRRVAEMHDALASYPQLADFKPEPIVDSDCDLWVGNVVERAHRIIGEINALTLNSRDQSLAERLARFEPKLSLYANSLIRPSVGRCKIRHHGDLHLGQVLIADQDAVIIDFEGEPSRPVAERRRKAPAARDVAGIIRSFDYSAMSFETQQHELDESASTTSRHLRTWCTRSTDEFLSAYQQKVGFSVLWPDRPEEVKAMIDFFLLEKALYEVEYELSYRPKWISVPLRGVLRILEGSGM
jgi:maltose alpha-D-glucosyltransferase/alpha-amylase